MEPINQKEEVKNIIMQLLEAERNTDYEEFSKLKKGIRSWVRANPASCQLFKYFNAHGIEL